LSQLSGDTSWPVSPRHPGAAKHFDESAVALQALTAQPVYHLRTHLCPETLETQALAQFLRAVLAPGKQTARHGIGVPLWIIVLLAGAIGLSHWLL
jgi:hypothetical protein